MTRLLQIGVCALLCSTTWVAGGGNGGDRAVRMVVPESTIHDVEIAMSKSMPPQFHITFKRDVPTPSWSLALDSLELDETSRRIVARVTEARSSGGISAQVITGRSLKLDLGTLAPGNYVLEIHVRRGTDGAYRPEHAMILAAF